MSLVPQGRPSWLSPFTFLHSHQADSTQCPQKTISLVLLRSKPVLVRYITFVAQDCSCGLYPPFSQCSIMSSPHFQLKSRILIFRTSSYFSRVIPQYCGVGPYFYRVPLAKSKHGLLENPSFLADFPSNTPPFSSVFPSETCFRTRG